MSAPEDDDPPPQPDDAGTEHELATPPLMGDPPKPVDEPAETVESEAADTGEAGAEEPASVWPAPAGPDAAEPENAADADADADESAGAESGESGAEEAPAVEREPPEGEPATIFAPFIESAEELPPEALPPEPAAEPPAAAPAAPAAASGEPRHIQPGDVLNHIFEVSRFIARGGMGEVFEGINVNTDEKVAIKVILPHLAADPQVQAMFRREARTLTRLIHPALVQYRVLAQEPDLGVFYIVTEFIEGENLSDVMGRMSPAPDELLALTRRLAEGLSAAHALGAIHRDISPDNVMLEEGKLGQAKIIDFGIAKDLDGQTKTIVGDGFAGKLNYVAPEQLGEYGREIGAWTDVYSLGLTLLAVASGRDVDMGGSLVDAVDKRRAEIDLSPAPPELQGVLREMLRANPAERARSMQQVLDLLSGARLAAAPASHEPTVFIPASELAAATGKGGAGGGKQPPAKAGGGLSGWKLYGLIGAGVFALIVAVSFWMVSGISKPSKQPGATGAAAASKPRVASEAEIRQVVTAALPQLPCSWVELSQLGYANGGVSLGFTGMMGRGADSGSMQESLAKLVEGNGLRANSIDFTQVHNINVTDCAPIETFRQFANTAQPRMQAEQPKFEIRKLGAEADSYAGKEGALAVLEIDLTGYAGDLAMIGIAADGTLVYYGGRKELMGEEQVRPNVFRVSVPSFEPGWKGLVLLTGTGPFDAKLLNGKTSERPADWSTQVLQAARMGNWSSEMVWYEVADEVPGN